MLDIDPQARSSMWEDIQAGRRTEIDFLNAQVVKMAAEENITAPVNHMICRAVKRLEKGENIVLDEWLVNQS